MKLTKINSRIPNLARRLEPHTSCLIVLCLFCVVAHSHGQGTFEPLHITFDGPPIQPPGTSYFVQEYFESDMWFRPLGVIGPGNGFGRVGSGFPADPDNGTAYLQATGGNSLMFSFLDGSVFDLISVDLAEYGTGVPDAVTVQFVGYRWDGGTVSTSFTTDVIIDGTGPLADFETFQFGSEWSGLTHVEVPTFGWSLDNLVVAVPEPSAWALLLAGGLLFWSLRRRGEKRW